MMNTIEILLIEDTPSDIRIMENAINDFNDENTDQIILHKCTTPAQAFNILRDEEIDAAIVDLRLGDNDPPGGVGIVNNILDEINVLTIIFSGNTNYTQNLSDRESGFFKMYTKGNTSTDEIIEEIYNVYRTGITQLLKRDGEIHEQFYKLLQDVFWKHISNSIEFWVKNNDKESLFRYVQSHILEHYKFDSSGNLGDYSAAELYITPPINNCEHTGDIIKINDKEWVIVSPACDMVIQYNKETRNADFITLVGIRPITDIIGTDTPIPLSNAKKDRIKKTLHKIRYYSLPLPKFGSINGGYIDFQKIRTIDQSGLDEQGVVRLGTIADPFIKDIVHQFSSYYSRQGAPGVNEDTIFNNLI